jgi:hypothetical protein
MKSFRDLYCATHGLAPKGFERALVRRSLHWHARPFYWLFALNEDYRAADFDFVRAVGDLRRRRDFDDEALAFYYHPHNGGFLRDTGRLRVSVERLKSIFEEEMRRAAGPGKIPAAPQERGGGG